MLWGGTMSKDKLREILKQVYWDGLEGSISPEHYNFNIPISEINKHMVSREEYEKLKQNLASSESDNDCYKQDRQTLQDMQAEIKVLREYKERLEPVMEELLLELPNQKSPVSDDVLVREAIAEIKALKELPKESAGITVHAKSYQLGKLHGMKERKGK